MSLPVSVVIPALGGVDVLGRCLASVEQELQARAAGDEIVLVDDTGTSELGPWAARHFPSACLVRRTENGGFAQALASGIARAAHDLVFSMNSDLVGRPGFLGPLVERLEDPEVFAVVPQVLRLPDATAVESFVRVRVADGLARVEQPYLEGGSTGEGGSARSGVPDAPPSESVPVPFALGGACLLRTSEFTELGGFDPLFEPFYMEDVDLCWRAWRAGRRVVLEPRSVCEHENQATIGRAAPSAVRSAAIERNTLLFQWKHLDADALADHVTALARRARRAWMFEERAELVSLALALEQAQAALVARRSLPAAARSFAEILAASDPVTRG